MGGTLEGNFIQSDPAVFEYAKKADDACQAIDRIQNLESIKTDVDTVIDLTKAMHIALERIREEWQAPAPKNNVT